MTSRIHIPPRDREQVVLARPAPGDREQQVARAFEIAYLRYERAFAELAKR